jgi:hypothetical protein
MTDWKQRAELAEKALEMLGPHLRTAVRSLSFNKDLKQAEHAVWAASGAVAGYRELREEFKQERLTKLRRDLSDAGDRRDSDECDSISAEISELMKVDAE